MHSLIKEHLCSLVLSATNPVWVENMSPVLFCWKRDLENLNRILQTGWTEVSEEYFATGILTWEEVTFFPFLLSAFKHPKDFMLLELFLYLGATYIKIYINARIKIKMEIYVTFQMRFFQQKGVLLCYSYC